MPKRMLKTLGEVECYLVLTISGGEITFDRHGKVLPVRPQKDVTSILSCQSTVLTTKRREGYAPAYQCIDRGYCRG